MWQVSAFTPHLSQGAVTFLDLQQAAGPVVGDSVFFISHLSQ
jgi:hypothetical protein